MDGDAQVEAMEESAFDFALDFQYGEGTLRPVLEQRNEKESDHGDADLSHDGIQRGAQEGFHLEVLFDPLEEAFHLPPALVQTSDGAGRPLEIVGQEHIPLSVFRVDIADAPERSRIFLSGLLTGQANGFIGGDAALPLPLSPLKDGIANLRFQPGDEESSCLPHTMEKGEVRVRPIQQKHTIPFYRIPPSHSQVVGFSVGDHPGRGQANRVGMECP